MLKKYKFILADKLQNIFYYLIRAYSRTFRLRVENEKPWLDHLRGGGRILLCLSLIHISEPTRPY